jgi:hypothetical protein
MALVLGTNSGFVTVAPTTDPVGGVDFTIDNFSVDTKHTSPAYPAKITEVGWYRGSGTNTANWEIGLYSDNSGVADALLYVEATNSSSVSGWLTRTVNWTISPNTAYWLAVQMDAHPGSSTLDGEASGGAGRDIITPATTLNNPFGGGAVANPVGMAAIYALVAPSFVPAWGANATTTLGGTT